MSEHERVISIVRQKNQAPFTLHPERTALLVIDVQRYFTEPDQSFGQVFERLSPGVTAGYFRRVRDTVVPNIRRLQDGFRARRIPIFFTTTGTHTGDGRDLPGWLRELDQLGLAVLGQRVWPRIDEPGFQVDERVAPFGDEPVLIKCSSGPVASTRLDQTLRNLGVDTVVVTGLTTDVCVTQTAREMADRGFTAVVVDDACTTLSDDMHRSALDCFNIAFGRLRSTTDVLELLAPTAASPVRQATPELQPAVV